MDLIGFLCLEKIILNFMIIFSNINCTTIIIISDFFYCEAVPQVS
jgi:hypothetical protein